VVINAVQQRYISSQIVYLLGNLDDNREITTFNTDRQLLFYLLMA